MLEIRQLFDAETSTYTYLLWDVDTRQALLIDTVKGQVERDLRLVGELDLNLKYLLETHIHADHITGAAQLREATSAKAVIHENAKNDCADLLVKDGDTLNLGEHIITILDTPGHTDTDISYLIDGAVFTGDALLIRSCGRTDFQSGDAGKLYDSITQKLFTLPGDTIVYPGHDYKGLLSSTIKEEKAYNPRLGGNRNKDAFINVMNSLDLEPPKRMAEAVPGNLRCGQIISLH
jgi:glyoxylase-like metal-dependent hydrolase (beta-lactamase superfamily II)